MTTPEEKLRDMILQKAKEGEVVFMTFDGPYSAPLNEFIKQPADGLLYDLNRDKVTVLTNIEDPKWVNDFAVALVIEKLKADNDVLQAKLDIVVKREIQFENERNDLQAERDALQAKLDTAMKTMAEIMLVIKDDSFVFKLCKDAISGVYPASGGYYKNDLNGAQRAPEKIRGTK